MTALRSRRLEALFGAPLDDLTAAHIRALVDGAVTEEFDLDYKEQLYGNSDGDRRALRIDIAALANTAGGIIVIGVAEDEQARATAASGVPLSDTEVGRMRQIIASGVSPMPVIDILSIQDENDQTTGFYVVAVPRSPNAPHAVLVDVGMRFPKRNGATTRYLSEPELAAAYRDRAAGALQQKARIAEVEGEAVGRLNRDEPWIVMSLVPDLPGDLVLSAPVYRAFEIEMLGKLALPATDQHTAFTRTSVGRRRLLADGATDRSLLAHWCSLELHTDGSAAFAMRVWDIKSQHRSADTPIVNILSDEGIVAALLGGLPRMARHARDRAAAGGDAIVRAQLVASRDALAMEIGHMRRGFQDSRSKVYLSGDGHAAETVVALDALTVPGPELARAAASLSNELGQAFGIPEMGQLTTDGELRIGYWGSDSQSGIKAWAEQNGITVTQQPLG